jgi:4-hydroxythreonine-4-phosphate dehydrogenase
LTAARPFLALTLGDPAGLGPRVGALAALDPAVRRRCRPLLIGDARILGRHLRTAAVIPVSQAGDYKDRPGLLNVLHLPHPSIGSLRLGVPSRVSGESAVSAVRAAVDLALARKVAAVVTGPVSKESLKSARVPFPGHTELLQALTGAKRVEMLMAAGPLRGLLVTRHLPLKDVSGKLSAREIVEAVRLTDVFLRRTIRRPRWAVLGLNPHAGDNGLLGSEEKRLVAPAVRRLKVLGLAVDGPLPADVGWARHAEGAYDACACLYHDQGMIPLKTTHPKKVVNITVGLPFVRTSPGHGTAFDLAGGKEPFSRADPSATIEAIHQALDAAPERGHN